MDRLIKVSLEDMAMRLLDFEIDDELSFAVYFDKDKENYGYKDASEWYGVKLIELFDSVVFVFNYYGGLNPFIIDYSEGLTLGEMIEKLKEYHNNNEYIIEVAE
jgi:hypothetical protein